MDGPVEEVCQMADDWKIWNDGDLPPEIWRFFKTKQILWDDYSKRIWWTRFFSLCPL